MFKCPSIEQNEQNEHNLNTLEHADTKRRCHASRHFLPVLLDAPILLFIGDDVLEHALARHVIAAKESEIPDVEFEPSSPITLTTFSIPSRPVPLSNRIKRSLLSVMTVMCSCFGAKVSTGCESYVRSVELITIVHHVEVKHGAVFRLADLNKPCGERSLRTVYGRVGSPVVWMANASAASQRHSSPRNFSMGPCHR